MITLRAALLLVGIGAPAFSLALAAASAKWLEDPSNGASLAMSGAWFAALLAIIYSVLAWARRQENVYLWFALAAWSWSARFVLPVLLSEGSPMMSELAIALTQTFFVATACMLAVRLIGHQSAWFEGTLAGVCGGAGLCILAAAWLAPEHLDRVIDASRLGIRIVGLWVAFLVMRALVRGPVVEVVILMFNGVVLMLISFDALWSALFRTEFEAGHFQSLASPLFGLTLAGMLLSRFLGALRAAESANVRLEDAVRRTRDELEREHEQVERLAAASATQAERERIMRDVHDGVGGHLVAALTLLRDRSGGFNARPNREQHDHLRERLEAALLDLRLVIDSLEDVEGDVGGILGMLRERMRPVLEAAGIRGRWRMSDLPSGLRLGAEQALDLMRVVQEAFTNAIRHAGARRIDVDVRGAGGGGLLITIDDDGHGFEGGQGGRGLENMRRRAERLAAKLDVSSSSEGTQVQLLLPPGSQATRARFV